MSTKVANFASRLFIVFIFLSLLLSVQGLTPTYAATLTVNNTGDSGAGSLRQAIADAASGETITFDPGLSGATIRLATTLTLSKDVTIDGSALASQIIISGDTDDNGTGNVGVFYVNSGITATLDSLIITKGIRLEGGGIYNSGTLTVKNSTLSGNSVFNWGYGGGISNAGTLTITNTTLSGNSTPANSKGGGISNTGTATVTGSLFSGNTTDWSGGSIYNDLGTLTVINSIFLSNSANSSVGGGIFSRGGTLAVIDSSFIGNSAATNGGGIYFIPYNVTTATVTKSTFSGNSAATNGGGIYSEGPLNIINSTFSGNSAGSYGGGISNTGGSLKVTNSTLSGNSALHGGGISNSNSGSLYYYNTIVANSPSGGDCYNTYQVVNNSNNLVEDGSCYAPLSGDPSLGVLANNGGLTQTLALLAGSTAINAGNDAICSAALVNNLDQRGIARPQGAHCDIGSFEYVFPTYTISGRVVDGTNNGLSGVSVSGGAGYITTTDGNGNYNLSGFEPGVYAITPSKAGYIFDPISRAIDIVNGNMNGVDFTGTWVNYSISGRVMDGNGNGIANVNVSAGAGHTTTTDGSGNYMLSGLAAGMYTLTPSRSGYAFLPSSHTVNVPPDGVNQDFTGSSSIPTVLIHDEAGHPVSGAQVFKNGALAGITASDGFLSIPGLTAGDQLVAREQIVEVASPRGGHDLGSMQNWAYRVYITSLDIPRTGEPAPFIVTNPSITQVLTVKKSNPLIGFNIVASVEWDANTNYLEELRQGFALASTYLYDVTDGQMLFEQVSLYDNAQNWANADYQLRASNQEWPHSTINSILSSGNLHIFFGRAWGGSLPDHGNWTASDNFRTLIHEFGHYGLGLYDSYLFYDQNNQRHDSNCTSQAIKTNDTAGINATLMDFQYNATEFAMQGVAGLWSQECESTNQWYENGESDWETIVDQENYRDSTVPARWTMNTPATHGGVVEGPTFIPVSTWTNAVIENNASSGICATPPVYRVNDVLGFRAEGADVLLSKSNSHVIQGKTDGNGEITILGAANGDQILFSSSGLDLQTNLTQVTCVTGQAPQFSSPGDPIVIALAPAAFNFTIATLPGPNVNQVVITVRPSVDLANVPSVGLSQSGSGTITNVLMTYNSSLGAYTGTATLAANLPPSGDLVVVATDLQSHSVTLASGFNIEAATVDQDLTIWSSDGRAEVYLAANTLSASGHVNISDGQITNLPDHLILLGGPYTLQGDEGLTLINDANLSLYYTDVGGIFSQVDPSLGQIYRWDGLSWQALPSISSQSQHVVSAAINTFGTYALMLEDSILPSVASIVRIHPTPTNAASVGFTITFSEPVEGVDMVGPVFDDFILATSSGISGASISGVSGSGTTYTVSVNTGSGNGTLRLNVGTAGNIVDAARNSLGVGFTSGEVYTIIKTATFADVPLSYWANGFIERLYISGITGGCGASPLRYCPTTAVTRDQMAVFILKAEHGMAYSPPAATGLVFTDVPLGYWAGAWIEALAAEGVTGGCGGGRYCPTKVVTRDQMAIFLLRGKYGNSYSPPTMTGTLFIDIPTGYWAGAWIEALAAEGITGGCGGGKYCPSAVVTRDQMAVFLVKAFNLP